MCVSAAPRRRPVTARRYFANSASTKFSVVHAFAICFSRNAEMPMNCGFLSRIVVCSSLSRALQEASHVHVFAAAKALAVTDSPSQNFFAAKGPKRRFGRRFGTQNAQIGPTDSLRRGRRSLSATPHGAREREIFATLGACACRVRRKFFRTCERRRRSRSDAETLLEKIVDRLRVGFAARSLHHLADEPSDRLRIGFGVADFVGILRDNLVDELFER